MNTKAGSGIDPFAPVWDDQPEGAVRYLPGASQSGIPYRAELRWSGSGWVLGRLTIGDSTDPVVAAWPGNPEPKGVPDSPIPLGELVQVAAEVAHRVADWELTRQFAQVWRAAAAGELDRDQATRTVPIPDLRTQRGHDELRVVSELYRFLVGIEHPSPTEALAVRMGYSRATAGRRIASARSAGLLGPAPRTAAGEV